MLSIGTKFIDHGRRLCQKKNHAFFSLLLIFGGEFCG